MAFDVRKAFARIRSKPEEDPRRQPLLVAELALWSAMTDGTLTREELAAITGVLREIPAIADFTVEDTARLVAEICDRYQSEDAIAARIEEVAGAILEPSLQRIAYMLAVMCASSDGVFSDDENAFLHGLQALFSLSDDDAERLAREAIG